MNEELAALAASGTITYIQFTEITESGVDGAFLGDDTTPYHLDVVSPDQELHSDNEIHAPTPGVMTTQEFRDTITAWAREHLGRDDVRFGFPPAVPPAVQALLDRVDAQWYDRLGAPIGMDERETLARSRDYTWIARTTVTSTSDPTVEFEISTVWTGGNSRIAPWEGEPLIFETMVFAANDPEAEDHDVKRYASEAEAAAGHDAMVTLLRATIPDCVVTDTHRTVLEP